MVQKVIKTLTCLFSAIMISTCMERNKCQTITWLFRTWTDVIILDKYLFNIRLPERKKQTLIFMRIAPAWEETPGLGLCVEFIWTVAVILIESRSQSDFRFELKQHYAVEWDLLCYDPLAWTSRSTSLVKHSLMFSRTGSGCFEMMPKWTLTMHVNSTW